MAIPKSAVFYPVYANNTDFEADQLKDPSTGFVPQGAVYYNSTDGSVRVADGAGSYDTSVGSPQATNVAAAAALTSVALTDNGGGTADNTVASAAAPVTLTDSTGGSGTHDDTLADGLTVVAFVADNGGGTADGTIDSQAAPVTITDSTGLDGTHDDTVAALTALTDYTPHAAGATPVTSNAATDLDTTALALETFRDEQAARNTVISQNQSDLSQKIIELVTLSTTAQNNLADVSSKVATLITDVGVQNQNASDLAQKVIEIVTWMGTMQNNLKEVTTQLAAHRVDTAEIRTQLNAEIAALKAAGLQASA